MTRLTLLTICLLTTLAANAQVSFGQVERFNQGWLFSLSDDAAAVKPKFDDKAWRQFDLPHDWSIEGELSQQNASCTGYLPGGIGWYRKHFKLTDYELCYIYFEGIYNRSEVYLNGHLLGKRPNGYISFLYDMTPYLRKGDNVLAVRVDHSRAADSRWYTGSGIYRDVWLVRAPKVHLSQWGATYRLTKLNADGSAEIEVDVAVDMLENASQNYNVHISFNDAEGKTVAEHTCQAKAKQAVSLTIPNARLWQLDAPYLYQLNVELLTCQKVIDQTAFAAGLRTLQFDANRGFALNGRRMKVKGVCLHHDAGVLGAVVPDEVWERRLMELKRMGANAIRMSHNPQAPVVYDLCDRLGLLVMDEASDEWEFPKRKWVEGWNVGTPSYEGSFDFFEEWIDRDVADMVRRDRNHPCIFLWSIGNEVDYPNDPYSHPVLDGDGAAINQPMFGGYKKDAPRAERIGDIAKRLSAVVRGIDRSRPVTGALAGVVMSNQTAYPDVIDVVGYNYTENRYDTDHTLYPSRIIYGSETGVGYDSWKAVRDKEHIFGQFVWTGTDYLGESGRWPSRGLNTGLLDFNSFRKPRGEFRAALWSEHPTIYIGTYPMQQRRGNGQRGGRQPRRQNNFLSPEAEDNWNYQHVGDTIRVVCYTNCIRARLLLNGQEVGSPRERDDANGIIHWDIPYHPGTLTVEGLDAEGNPVTDFSITTSGPATKLDAHILSAQKPGDIKTGDIKTGRVSIVEITINDAGDHRVRSSRNEIICKIEGPAVLLGLEGANNSDMSNYRDNHQPAYRGRLVAYIRRTGSAPVRITFSSEGLESKVITL